LLAEGDHQIRRDIRRWLETDGRFEVCSEVDDAAAAVDESSRYRPDICLLDLGLPGGGVSAARQIIARLPRTRVVMLVESEDDRDLLSAIRAGVLGYLPKTITPRGLMAALADAADGIATVPRSLMATLMEELRAPMLARRRTAAKEGENPLTSREWEILQQVLRGRSDTQIGRRLAIAPSTVRWYVHSILKKLDLPDRRALRSFFDAEETRQ
jgi:DNA-binding NarL/FixJ family response regulator